MNKKTRSLAGFHAVSARSHISRAENDSFCLPGQVIAVVPNCALSCLQSFAQTNYDSTACSDLSNLNYLCTQSTTQGLTIGEAVLACVVSSCADSKSFEGYNICTDIPGAMANTATLITATVTSPPLTSLPASVGRPSSIEQVASIVTASGIPTILVTTVPPAATVTSNSVPLPQPTVSVEPSSVFATSGTLTASLPLESAGAASTPLEKTRLHTSSIIGIAAGAGGIALIAFGLFLYWYCRRRKRQSRRRSNRWSEHIPTAPAPLNENPQTPPRGPATYTLTPSPYDQTQRYYSKALPEPMQEKRRSFWRKSIKPEDIGVAVSPDLNNESPMSFSSQQSTDKLLPKLPKEAIGRTLWPAPLNFETNKHVTAYTYHHTSMSTIFDEDDSRRLSQAPIPTEVQVSEKVLPAMVTTPAAALKTLQLSHGSPIAARSTVKSVGRSPYPARIPLTPTYDNGNYIGTPFQSCPPSSYPGLRKDRTQNSVAAHYALPRRVLFSQHATVDSERSGDNLLTVPASSIQSTNRADASIPLVPELIRNNSDTTAGTEIEDQQTPGDTAEQLNHPATLAENVQGQKLSLRKGIATPRLKLNSNLLVVPELDRDRSPISRLKYPAIPRSAAISSQAEVIAQPVAQATPNRKAVATPVPVGIPNSKRQSNGASSECCTSDSSIEFPTPPVGGRNVANRVNHVQTPLREDPKRANMQLTRGTGVKTEAVDVLADAESVVIEIPRAGLKQPAQAHLQTPQRLPISKVRVTPRKDQSGDLYLTVEI